MNTDQKKLIASLASRLGKSIEEIDAIKDGVCEVATEESEKFDDLSDRAKIRSGAQVLRRNVEELEDLCEEIETIFATMENVFIRLGSL